MKYVQQFSIILLISVIGELLKTFLPLPVPASVYGLVIMLVALLTGIPVSYTHLTLPTNSLV